MRLHRVIKPTVLTVFASLLIAACAGGAQPDNEQVKRGRVIYAASCQVCHGNAVTGENALDGAPTHGPDGHTWHHADGQLAGIILGQLIYPDRTMPSFEETLSEDDVTAILTFFKTNWLSEQLEFQAEATRNWEELQKDAP